MEQDIREIRKEIQCINRTQGEINKTLALNTEMLERHQLDFSEIKERIHPLYEDYIFKKKLKEKSKSARILIGILLGVASIIGVIKTYVLN